MIEVGHIKRYPDSRRALLDFELGSEDSYEIIEAYSEIPRTKWQLLHVEIFRAKAKKG